jgi:hypothetical protein
MDNDVSMVILPDEVTFSINENISDFIDKALLVYPNPVKDQARISMEIKKTSNLQVVITDIAGRTIYSQFNQVQQGMQDIILPVGNLPAGIYQVVLVPEDKIMVSGKFLKTN